MRFSDGVVTVVDCGFILESEQLNKGLGGPALADRNKHRICGPPAARQKSGRAGH